MAHSSFEAESPPTSPSSITSGVLEGVPVSLPSLVKAIRIQEKAKGIGFEWETAKDVWKKVKEEMNEFESEMNTNSDKMEEEFGDLLFSLVNYARFIDLSPESALSKTNQKFIARFQLMEKLIKRDNRKIESMPLTEMDQYWDRAKLNLQKTKDLQ